MSDFSLPAPAPHHCAECLDTFATDFFFLKLLSNPSRLYIVTRFLEPCPYCLADGDDSSSD